jgi:hypothetical protein
MFERDLKAAEFIVANWGSECGQTREACLRPHSHFTNSQRAYDRSMVGMAAYAAGKAGLLSLSFSWLRHAVYVKRSDVSQDPRVQAVIDRR